ncbi:AraC family transcriptional regulator [Roseateles koreensis]|uniref:AraC family transcriptional regulator n=1 Tax=Roseateles koreensis TaxID=2987526 RepID=A0ABT5KYN3_9BURK|nr:AraC family transcriptional regulator [Roseateles koreensis]MDC8786817.1 AraC family transcriptional regulator [Roseateles koreensis]
MNHVRATAEKVTVERDTVSMYFANAALRHLTPVARERVLGELDIPESWLGVPHARMQAATFSALWLAVARELDDEFFGLGRRAMKVGSFALLCQAVLHCENLERAIKRMLRGFSVFLDDLQLSLTQEGDEARVHLRNGIADEADRRFADETLLVLIHGLMCWLAGRRIELLRVDFAHARPAHVAEYTAMFSKNLSFDAAHTVMGFDAQLLVAPVVQNSQGLQRFLQTAPQSVVLKYKNEDSWTARVRRRLRACQTAESLGDWPRFEAMAQEMGQPPTTFRRRLEAEGSRYQGIKDQLRNEWAIERLSTSTMSLDEMAAHLGFHDASAFHRAFSRWNGVQPGEYRRRRLAASEAVMAARSP